MFALIRSLSCGLILLLANMVTAPLAAQQLREITQDYPGIRVEQLLTGLGIPWGMTFISPHQLLITERAGSVRLLDIRDRSSVSLGGAAEVVAEGQGGLLDVAIGPNYSSEGWIYFTYTRRVDSEAATTLARARLDQERLVDWQDLLITDTATDARRHFGSRIAFDDKGHVFFGVGDRGERDMAQDLSNHIGTIMRLNLDGSVPVDNPFVGTANARDEIWSYGHRNPQGAAIRPGSDDLWVTEHGPQGGDEINKIVAGGNFGWPVVSYGCNYGDPVSDACRIGGGVHAPNHIEPVSYWVPVSIAPSGMIFYTGTGFPQWQGNLFVGALVGTALWRVELNKDQEVLRERLFFEPNERIRDVEQGPDGWIYLLTDSGKLVQIRD